MSNSTPSPSSTPLPNSTTTIDDLPEPLITHILSFLYIQDAIRTSLVSHKFLNLWHFLPSLHFDIYEFYTRSTSKNPRSNVSRHEFAEFISHALSIRKSYPLTKIVFTFEYANYGQHITYVQNWIQKAINFSVSELVLEIIESDDRRYYKWCDVDYDIDNLIKDFSFYLADIGDSCIKVLSIYACYIDLPPSTIFIKFVCLKSLELVDSFVRIIDQDLCDLISTCVNLETLKLKSVGFDKIGLRIYSATLRELDIEACWGKPSHLSSPLDFDICCPSLQKIRLVLKNVGKYSIKDTTSLVEAWVDLVPFYQKEKSWEKTLSYFTNILSLHVWDELLESNEIPVGCERFVSNVKHLELYSDYTENDLVGLAALLKLLPKLEILELHNRGSENVTHAKFHKDYWRASTVFNMPCVLKVTIRKYQKTIGEQHFIKLFRKNGIVLEKIELLDASNMEIDEQ